MNAESPDSPAQQEAWHQWLLRRHGSVARLNQRWAGHYESFEQVPVPADWGDMSSPPHYEFVLFNQEWFAAWHQRMADAIHQVAPKVPVHAKAMTWNFFSDLQQRFGVDAELFGQFSQIQGNDSFNLYSHGQGPWVQAWDMNNKGHDLQRSVADLPVFNSENHLIADGETRTIPPEHIRTTLWQAAVHGQSATTIWVWDRTYDPQHVFAGSIMTRPLCVDAAGRTGLDLLRLGEQVRALQTVSALVGLLYSTTALVYDRGAYTDCLHRLYVALTFTGCKLGFVTERQLMTGKGHRPPILLVPNVRHLPAAALDALEQYPGRVVLVGGPGCLERSEYDQRQRPAPEWERIGFDRKTTQPEDLWPVLLQRLPAWHVKLPVEVTDIEGEPVWGVEWLTAQAGEQPIVNLIRHARQAVRIRIRFLSRPARGTDLLTGEKFDSTLKLAPLRPRLLALD
jgi:hypothetical protein